MRKLSPNRWNWSEKDKKWVFIETCKNGKTLYQYRIDPPKEFVNLTYKIKILNEKMIIAKNPEESEKIFNEMMKISKKIQNMRKKS
ncbi:MAG: hypothetical protein ACTSV5_15075 [Promethearchaeota archaeon]